MKPCTRTYFIIFWILILAGCSESRNDANPAPGPNAGFYGTGGLAAAGGSGGAGFPDSAGYSGTMGGTVAIGNSCGGPITETDKDGNPLIHVLDANNYHFRGSLTIPTVRVKSSTNLAFDWSEVTRDLRGRDLDPLLGVDQLRVVLFKGATEAELTQLMSEEGDILRYVYGPVFVDTQNAMTSAKLLDLHPPAGDIPDADLLAYVDTEVYPPDQYSYAAMLGEGSVISAGFLLITFIRPDPNESVSTVKFTNDSTRLDYTVDLTSLQKITIPAGVSNITMKWTDDTLITKTATGNEFRPTAITDVMVGHYPNMTIGDVENQFLNVDGIAETIWSKFLDAGTSISLADLQTETGEPFSGIDQQGTWLFVLRCGSCTSPVPWFLTVLQACTE